jgi:hypothetical protein
MAVLVGAIRHHEIGILERLFENPQIEELFVSFLQLSGVVFEVRQSMLVPLLTSLDELVVPATTEQAIGYPIIELPATPDLASCIGSSFEPDEGDDREKTAVPESHQEWNAVERMTHDKRAVGFRHGTKGCTLGGKPLAHSMSPGGLE